MLKDILRFVYRIVYYKVTDRMRSGYMKCPDCGIEVPDLRFWNHTCQLGRLIRFEAQKPQSIQYALPKKCADCGEFIFGSDVLHKNTCSGKKVSLPDSFLIDASLNKTYEFNLPKKCPDCGEFIFGSDVLHKNTCSGKKVSLPDSFLIDASLNKNYEFNLPKKCPDCGKYITADDYLHSLYCPANSTALDFSLLGTNRLVSALSLVSETQAVKPVSFPILDTSGSNRSILVGFPDNHIIDSSKLHLYFPSAMSSSLKVDRIRDLEREVGFLRGRLDQARNKQLAFSGFSVLLHITDFLCPPLSGLLRMVGTAKTYIEFFTSLENRFKG